MDRQFSVVPDIGERDSRGDARVGFGEHDPIGFVDFEVVASLRILGSVGCNADQVEAGWRSTPGRMSMTTESTGIAAWPPPQNAETCSGVVKAAQTSSCGAFNRRVMVSSPSWSVFVEFIGWVPLSGGFRGVFRERRFGLPTVASGPRSTRAALSWCRF